MASSGMLRRVALIRTDISDELSRVTRIGELGTTLAVTNSASVASYSSVLSSPILINLIKEVLRSSETSVLTRATQRNIPEDAILHSYHRENFIFYKILSFVQSFNVTFCSYNYPDSNI
jgi:hypothetical protein